MKLYIYCIILFFSIQTVFAYRENSTDKFTFSKKSLLYDFRTIEFESYIILEMNKGFGEYAYGKYVIGFEISTLINPYYSLLFRYDTKILEKTSIINRMKVLPFLHIISGYTFWNYSEYSINEHNLFFHTDLRLSILKYAIISLYGGPGFKIVDLNTNNFSFDYKTDFFSQIIISWRLSFNFFITKYFHTAFEISNLYDNDQISLGALQLESKNTFYPSKRYGFVLDYGVGFAGSGSVSGFINRFWISFGGFYRHEI